MMGGDDCAVFASFMLSSQFRLHAGALRKIPEENLDAEYITALLLMDQRYQIPYFKAKSEVILL